MSDVQANPIGKSNKKAREGRSPAFPFIDLRKAIERAEEFRLAEGKHSVPVASARKAWKLGEESVVARRTVAALGYFGLFEDEGAGDKRKVRLSDSALKILLDKQPVSFERDGLIRETALKPALHKELWEKWGHELPSDATIETFLVRDRGFSSSGAVDLMVEYKNTLAFAKLNQSAIMSPDDGDPANPDLPRDQASVGDFVQWESDGVLRLDVPKRVRAIQEHGGRQWVFIEGSETGIPMDQVRVDRKGAGGEDKPPAPPTLPESPAFRTEAGEREWLRGPLSRDVNYRLIVSGDLGPKEIGKLIKMLKAQQAVLSDDDGDDDDEAAN